MKMMHLFAATNNVGSKCSCELDITEEDWNNMTDKEKDEEVGVMLSNICEYWVKAVEDN